MLKRQDLAAMASTWLLVLLAWAAFSPTASAQLNRVSVNQIIGTLTPGNGGTGSAFFQVAGPASSIKTFTFPNASANVLTDNALVTAAQGGTSNGFFAVSGPASTTKTFTFPNASDTVATYAVANNFSAAQTTSLTGLALTSTDGGVLVNTTAATGGTTVQMSPRLRLRGTAWDTSASETVDFFIENLPATAATPTGTLNVGYSLNGAAATFPLTLTSGGTLTVLGSALVGSGGSFQISSKGRWVASANKLWQLTDSGNTTGIETNGGTPTLGTCTGGTLTSGSHNMAGEVTGTTGGSCAINFGTPNWTNAPYCTATDETAGGIVNVTAHATSGITIGNITSGHNVMWVCVGRIGT